ncbi:MAG: TlpA disulfide reductase family protein [Oligoflexia bacterium]|nr:TlpA disulfide reductase family protein [Oligoflexia bacterium]
MNETEDQEEVVLRQSEGPVGDSNRPQKRINIPFWGKVLIMCAIVFFASIGYLRSSHYHDENIADIQDGPTDVPAPEKRKVVPDILMVASPGNTKRLSDFKGKVVLLSFWASWCTPCLIELPTFIDLHEKLASKGLVIIPLNVDEPDTASKFVPDFWKARKFPFATFYDPTHSESEKFNIESLPSNFVLDKQGRLVAQGYGANDWGSEASVKFIEQLLTE